MQLQIVMKFFSLFMEISVFKLRDYSFYISILEKLNITTHLNNEIIYSEEISKDFSIKKFNIRMLKFLMSSLSHFDLKKCKEGDEKLQQLAKFSSLLVNLNYEISTELLIKIFVLLSEVHKVYLPIFFNCEFNLYAIYSELLILKTILNKIIDSRFIS